jgi:hypothetical protein
MLTTLPVALLKGDGSGKNEIMRDWSLIYKNRAGGAKNVISISPMKFLKKRGGWPKRPFPKGMSI